MYDPLFKMIFQNQSASKISPRKQFVIENKSNKKIFIEINIFGKIVSGKPCLQIVFSFNLK